GLRCLVRAWWSCQILTRDASCSTKPGASRSRAQLEPPGVDIMPSRGAASLEYLVNLDTERALRPAHPALRGDVGDRRPARRLVRRRAGLDLRHVAYQRLVLQHERLAVVDERHRLAFQQLVARLKPGDG